MVGCAAVQAGASLVKSASVSNLGHLVKAYTGQQPFASQLPTLHAAKAPDGLGGAPSPSPLGGNAGAPVRCVLCMYLPVHSH